MKEKFRAVILAAGQGTRMKSERAKVLHEAGGRALIAWAIDAALGAGADEIVTVLGHERAAVAAKIVDEFPNQNIRTAIQAEQRGTGHAVQIALPELASYEGLVVILYGDCPLIRASTVKALVERTHSSVHRLGLIVARLEDPTGYGRIIRDQTGALLAIREQRDASPEELAIDEVNPGVYAIDAAFLRDAIKELRGDNAQGELYLTDVVAMAAKAGGVAELTGDMHELRGVNDRFELATCDRILRLRRNAELARAGVTILDPENTWIDPQAEISPDAVIETGVHLRGACQIGQGAHLDVGAILTDVIVETKAHVKPYTVASDSRIGELAQVGPFSHLRPGTDLGPEARIGNFVETKQARLGRRSKANHLAYLGDGEIGEDVNVGAGTIFCNYDGFRKSKTVLEDGVFIGSDSQLVAPVTVGRGAYVATGTTVTRDVPPDALAVGRTRQENKDGYAPRLRAKLKAASREPKR